MGILQVNHIDHNRQNNRLNNLEWVTPSENSSKGVKFGNVNKRDKSFYTRIGSAGKRVRCLNDGKIYNTMKAAAAAYSLSIANVSDSANNNKQVKGYKFVILSDIVVDPSKLNDPNTSVGHLPSAVYCYQTDCVYKSRNEAARQLNISVSSIVDSLRDGRPHSGYTFTAVT